MASIIADLSDDIKKMKSLKEEIQQVKRELGSINVKVELDIKRDMEARLKALTGQYDALVQKVAQAEARIAESTSRINKSAETIIKAQEQITKSASGQADSSAQGASGGNSSATNAQTASVQAQAKAYDELKDAIEGYLGTMEGNARYIAETESAISNVKKNISLLRKEIDAKGGIANEAQLNNLAHYTEELERLKIQLQDARRDLKTDLRINVAGEGSLAQLRNQLLQMQRVWDGMVESVRNSPIGQDFAKSIDVLNKQVSELEQTMGRYQRNVGNYASGWNGLNMSIQQIGRELPSLAMGWNTFFLAISNNLPILTDEIKRAKDEYNALKSAGQQATPVWKQVISSLLSWQTALTVGITLLTLYGSEIIDWVSGLFKAKDGTAELEEATKRLNTAVSGVYGNISEEMRSLKQLSESLNEAKRGTEEWNQVRNKIVTEYSKYLPSIDKEIDKTGTLAESYDRLAESIRKAAAARGFEELKNKENEKYAEMLVDNYQKVYERLIDVYGQESGQKIFENWKNWAESSREIPAEVQKAFSSVSIGFSDTANSLLFEIRNQQKAREQTLDRFKEIFDLNEDSSELLPSDSIKALRDRISAQREALEKLSVSSKEYKDLLASIQKDEQKLSILTSSPKDINKSTQSIKDYLDELTKLREDNEDRQVELMEYGTEKQIAEIKLRYKRMREKVQELENNLYNSQGGKLTKEQSAMFNIAYTGIEELQSRDERKATEDAVKKRIQAEREAMRDYLKEYGSYQEKRLAITEEYQQKISRAETEGEKFRLKKQLEEALKELSDEEARLLTGNSGFFSRLFSDSSAMTRASLKKVIREAKELTDYLNGFSSKKPAGYSDDQLESLKGNAESIKGIYDALIEKQDELDRRTDYPFNGIVKGFEKLRESSDLAKKALKETDTQKKNILQGQSEAAYGKGVDYLREGAVEASDAVGYLSEQMSALADATGNAKFKEFADQFSAFSQNLQAAGQGAQSGGWIGAIVGGASDMINQTFAAFAQVKAEEYEFEQNRIDFLQELERLSVTLKEEDYDSIFGVNSIEKAREAYVLALEALRKYEEAVSERTMPEIEKEHKNLGAAIFSGGLLGFGFGKRISEETKTLLKAYEKGYTDLQAMAVKTKDRSGWANFWGKKDEYTALKDLAPQLWDDDGSFNIDAAEAFLETNTQINDEQRKQIQNVIDLKKAYDENISVIDEMLSSTFGNLSEDITDAIFDSVRNGADAWSLFEEAGSEVIDELGRQLVQQMYVQSYLDTFTERMRAAYGLDSMQDTQEELASIMKDIFNGLGTVLEGASSAAEDWDRMAEEYGFSIDKETPEQQSASSGGYETMTQDQASELSGRFTALNESSLRQEAIQQGISNIADDMRNIIAQSYLELQQISENTGAIIVPIQKMQKDMEIVKQNTSRI